jgi:CotH kinase protein
MMISSKKVSVFFCLIIASLQLLLSSSARAQCCEYTLVINDSYGDGWDGAELEIFINDISLGLFTTTAAQTDTSISVCTGDLIELVYFPGDYEEEHSYALIDASYNVVQSDGPNPTQGEAFSGDADCNTPIAPGHYPCTALSLAIDDCADANNTLFESSGLNPGCGGFAGGDIWYKLEVPASGNLSVATSNGGLNDTGLAAWGGENCDELNLLGCDDDSGPGYYSTLLLFDLNPGDTIYVQAFGYGGGAGSFQLCASDLGVVVFENSELPIVMISTLNQDIVNDIKIDALMDIKYNGPGNLTYIDDPSNVYSGNVGIEIRGATSAGYPAPSYGFETRTETGDNNNVSLLNMPEENDWVLLSNINDFSFLRNALAFKLFGEMNHFSVRTQLCEVLIDSSYKGIYTFAEKIKRDDNRVDIATLTTTDNAGDSLTGGYVLQQNYWNEFNSFQSNFSPIDHPDFDVHFVYEYPKPNIITTQQKDYIASYIDSLETALYGETFMDPVNGYRKYLSTKSFIDYFLVNEFARNNDGFKKSVFFNKNRNSNGGKLKAGPVWDFDWGFKDLATCDIFDNTDGSGWAHLINDCPTDNYSTGWYVRLLQDSTYANETRCIYEDYRTNILDTVHLFAYIDSMHALLQNAQSRHYQRWPILGSASFAPELDPIANSYAEEISKLKSWMATRLAWLDENIPGLCAPIIDNVSKNPIQNKISFYPNPSDGPIKFAGETIVNGPMNFVVYDVAGRVCFQKILPAGKINFDFSPDQPGVYFFSFTQDNNVVQQGKLVAQ